MSISSQNADINLEGYNIVGEIGRGSYARVYKAIHLSSREVVAIKCVERKSLSPSAQDNIIMEIRLLKVLQHDNIVQMKDFTWDDRYVYIILEFCDGGDLSKFIKKRQKLPEIICKRFMQQLALGLQFLKSKNICHLDLKPSNLLLVTKPSLSLKIGDFGFAGFLSDEAIKQTIRGSPLYMAPEVLLGSQSRSKADLWSVGVILFECLFGKAPLCDTSCKQLLLEVKNRIPIEIPEDVISPIGVDILKKLLVYDSNKRMTYEQFFAHPFLDLEHFPGEDSYFKAVQIAREAVKLDNNMKYVEAFNMYCTALNYLMPFLNDDNVLKREKVRAKILEYTKRAETIKVVLHKAKDAFVTQPDPVAPTQEFPLEGEMELEKEISRVNVKEFKTLCAKTPKMLDGVDIGYAAQMYMYEGKYEVALEKFKLCFSILIPILSEEPEGRRKKILVKQVEEWMKQAESVKILIHVQQSSEAFDTQPKEHCVVQ